MVRILDLEKYAKENNIPIMQKDGIDFMCEYIKKNNIKNILEVGAAIGYSAIRMASISNDIKVTTIERDEKRYKEAVKNIESFNLEQQINIIFNDAFDVELNEQYDLIFIDAAKSQYIKFFEKYKEHFLFLSISPFYTQKFAFGCKFIIRIFCRLFDIVPQGGFKYKIPPAAPRNTFPARLPRPRRPTQRL